MAKKLIDVMDTSFRDGFQSVFGGRVKFEDFAPAISAACEAGISHFEFGGGARFQAPVFYLNEDPFDIMDKFRAITGPSANLQTLARGINTVALDTGSREVVDLHAKMFKKHSATTIRNFDALNDVQNLEYSAKCIVNHNLKHEVVVTIMDLPPGCKGAHDVPFYEKTIRQILDSGIKFTSFCFKDASGTANPHKVHEIVKMARKLLPEKTHIRVHTHETAGISTTVYLAALEAGADGIDLASEPVSGGTSQPDILTMIHVLKGYDYDLGFDPEKILKYQDVFKECLVNYFKPPESFQVSPIIRFSPMPGGALTANTQMMRDINMLDKFPEVIREMREVVERGGFGTSVTPVSQFYFQQAYSNVLGGKWNQITDGYGRMVLGYFGKTPVAPDPEIVKLAEKQLKLPPTTENPLDIADRDEKKRLEHWRKRLTEEKLKINDENLFIAASCNEKGITFLKGDAKCNVRMNSDTPKVEAKANSAKQNEDKRLSAPSTYFITIDGQEFEVNVQEEIE